MKSKSYAIIVVFAFVILSGCSISPTDVGQANQAPKIKVTNQVGEGDQADQGKEATETAATDEPDQADETNEPDENGQPDEPKAADEVVRGGEVDQASETGNLTETAAELANVISVQAAGNSGSYTFSVGIASPDTGCQLYADWWEVLSEEGTLIYRRVLLHSHVSEQPFVRSGGPVEIAADEVVWVRAHMSSGGYGGAAFKGSVATGFQPAELRSQFAADVANLAPLPNGCNF